MKKIVKLILIIAIIFNIPLVVFAEGSVSYSDNAQEFIFEPGSKYSPTDLFSNFKDVMPGDKITQKIVVNNKRSKDVKIKLYLKSLGTDERTKKFLSYMRLTVKQEDDSILFEGPADQITDITKWCYLGTIYSGGKITLNITLDVSVELGDEFQNSIGYVDWSFKVEEFPVSDDDPVPPNTSDNIVVYFIIGSVSLLILILLLLYIKKYYENNKKKKRKKKVRK